MFFGLLHARRGGAKFGDRLRPPTNDQGHRHACRGGAMFRIRSTLSHHAHRSSPSPAITPARGRDRNNPRHMSRPGTEREAIRGLMRPRLAAALLVNFPLGRQRLGFPYPGLRSWLRHELALGCFRSPASRAAKTASVSFSTTLRFRRVLQCLQLLLPLFGLVRLVRFLIELHKVRHDSPHLLIIVRRGTGRLAFSKSLIRFQ